MRKNGHLLRILVKHREIYLILINTIVLLIILICSVVNGATKTEKTTGEFIHIVEFLVLLHIK